MRHPSYTDTPAQSEPVSDVAPDSGSGFEQELKSLINKYSMENVSNTPDFILATYLLACLAAYNSALTYRTAWYGLGQEPANIDGGTARG